MQDGPQPASPGCPGHCRGLLELQLQLLELLQLADSNPDQKFWRYPQESGSPKS